MMGHFECGNEERRCKKWDKFTGYFSDYQYMNIRCIMDIITVWNLLIMLTCFWLSN